MMSGRVCRYCASTGHSELALVLHTPDTHTSNHCTIQARVNEPRTHDDDPTRPADGPDPWSTLVPL